MNPTDDTKKIIQNQDDQNYSGDEVTGEDSENPRDIDALAEEVLGNTIDEDKPLNIAEEVANDEAKRHGPPEDDQEEQIVDPTTIKPLGDE